jgi:hypothetical protein
MHAETGLTFDEVARIATTAADIAAANV